ncbi:MAG: EAL domain-containing protein [Pseudomonadota bacterium]
MKSWSRSVALVVEDSSVQRQNAVELLRLAGCGVVLEACDGIDALRVIAAQTTTVVDLVLTDLDMPGMDGIELIRHLGARQLAPQVIVASSNARRLAEARAVAVATNGLALLGALEKPLTAAALAQAMQADPDGADPAADWFTPRDINVALAAAQFIPYYQPKVALDSGALRGVEALVRWQHPQRGVLPPSAFLPAIQGTDAMPALSLALADQAMEQLAKWHAMGLVTLTMSVNLSVDVLAQREFMDQLASCVARHHLAPDTLVWEVTESAVMSDPLPSLANLGRMSLRGHGLALDDYGIGQASLQQLSRYPLTELKIDGVFVREAGQRPARLAVLAGAVALAERLGIASVAEGVETEQDWDELRRLGCAMAQGHLLARPMAGHELAGWYQHNRARLRALAARPF